MPGMVGMLGREQQRQYTSRPKAGPRRPSQEADTQSGLLCIKSMQRLPFLNNQNPDVRSFYWDNPGKKPQMFGHLKAACTVAAGH